MKPQSTKNIQKEQMKRLLQKHKVYQGYKKTRNFRHENLHKVPKSWTTVRKFAKTNNIRLGIADTDIIRNRKDGYKKQFGKYRKDSKVEYSDIYKIYC